MFSFSSTPSTSTYSDSFPTFPSFISSPRPTTNYESGDSGSSTFSISSNYESAITSMEFGQLSELPSSQEILKTLECSVCTEVFYPPIFNCNNGHSVCALCRSKLKKCALCKGEYSGGRNYLLESLVNNAKFHCRYKDRGCLAVINGENFRQHLQNCSCRPGAAPVPSICQSPPREEDDGKDDDVSSKDSEEFQLASWAKCKNGQYPLANAVVAGYSAGEAVFVARAYHGARLILGRLIPAERGAYVYWHGCQKKWYYEVLVAVPGTYEWLDASWGDLPENAYPSGQSPDLEDVYIGRALSNNKFVPGFVQPSCQGCFIGVANQLYLCHEYQVLVFKI